MGVVDWLLCVPPGLRARGAGWLDLEKGDRVLEIGCGTGRNFRHLQQAVGPQGRIYGVDLSAGMLQRARALCERQGWRNVALVQGDAAEFTAPEPLDGILFGFSYNTMPHHREVLDCALQQLRPGGRIVIMDGKLPRGFGERLLLPFSLWLMKSTMLGNPLIKPWHDLARVTKGFEMEEFLFGSWYVCRGSKEPHSLDAERPLRHDAALDA
jgi:demethylmenaquinone methyltransferase/2-methoxy-6-polyprenyl-1,4-benzoquinol methylase